MRQGLPPASRCVFREDFLSVGEVQRNGGVVTGATINGGLLSGGPTSRVAWGGTESLLANAAEATFVFRVRTAGAGGVQYQTICSKNPNANTDNQWIIQLVEIAGVFYPYVYIASAFNDTSNGAYGAAIAPNTDTTLHIVYKGANAAATRLLYFTKGVQQANPVVFGTIPTRMRASAVPMGGPNYYNGVAYGMTAGGILYSLHLHDFAMSAAEVMDDYKATTFQGSLP